MLTINRSDPRSLVSVSLKHDLKIECKQLLLTGPAKTEAFETVIKSTFDFSPFVLFFSWHNGVKTSLSKNHRWVLRPSWILNSSQFCTFVQKLVYTSQHSTVPRVVYSSHLKSLDLIRVVFKGKIRDWQILLNPLARHFTAIYNSVSLCLKKSCCC